MNRTLPLVATAFLLVPLLGCASASGGGGDDELHVNLRVVNQSGTRIGVSVSWADGTPVFVSEVQSRRDRTFQVAFVQAADIHAVVEFMDGGGVRTSDDIPVHPGDTIILHVDVNRVPDLDHDEDSPLGGGGFTLDGGTDRDPRPRTGVEARG